MLPGVRSGKPDQDLVEIDVVENLDARSSRKELGHPPGVGAAAFDQLGQAVPPKRAQNGVDREAPCPAR